MILAFLIGGLVVLATTGKNPLTTYKAIFEGAGFNWFLEVGSYELRHPVHGRAHPVPVERRTTSSRSAASTCSRR